MVVVKRQDASAASFLRGIAEAERIGLAPRTNASSATTTCSSGSRHAPGRES